MHFVNINKMASLGREKIYVSLDEPVCELLNYRLFNGVNIILSSNNMGNFIMLVYAPNPESPQPEINKYIIRQYFFPSIDGMTVGHLSEIYDDCRLPKWFKQKFRLCHTNKLA